MKLFDKHNIHELTTAYMEKHTLIFDKSIQIWIELIQHSIQRYIQNIDCDIRLLVDKDLALPIVIPNAQYDNSYVCSPYAQYIKYGYREIDIELKDKPLYRKTSKNILALFEKITNRDTFDNVIFVNNWLVSTNLYPSINVDQIHRVKAFLIEKFPNKAIIFRSISEVLNPAVCQILESEGFQKIVSRQVYIVDPKKEIYKKKKAFKEDLRLSRKRKEYTWIKSTDLTREEIERVKKFYDDLYIQKYSIINPQFTYSFFEKSIQKKWLSYLFLKKGNQIEACFGYINKNGIMTSPIIGYNFELPQKVGLYRLISLEIVREGVRKNLIIHSSSGASHFKKVRGAESSFEYNLVFYDHLSFKHKIPWRTLMGLTKYVAEPILKQFEL